MSNTLRADCLKALCGLSLVLWGTLANAQAPTGSGPWPAAIAAPDSLPGHTLYYPDSADALGGRPLPVVVWGNGSCVNSNFGYREFLAEIASHGFLVVATGPYQDAPPPRQPRPADPAQWPPFETSPGQLFDAISWAFMMNTRTGSAWEGRIDTQHIAVMGHSCGAIQALEASFDKRVTTTVVLNSGLFPDEDNYQQRFAVRRRDLASLSGPVAFFIGGETDIAYANAMENWPLLPAPAIIANLPVGHGATYNQPNGGPFAAGPLAWLQWQLQGDSTAGAMFTGAQCGFCTDTDWRIERRGIQ